MYIWNFGFAIAPPASQKWTESFIQNFSCTIYGSANAGKGIELWEQNLHKSLSEEHSSIFCWPLLERPKVPVKKSCAGLFYVTNNLRLVSLGHLDSFIIWFFWNEDSVLAQMCLTFLVLCPNISTTPLRQWGFQLDSNKR